MRADEEWVEGRCERHSFEAAESVCVHCGYEFCHECLVYSHGAKKPPYCVKCALAAAGIRSTAGHTPRASPREIKKELKARKGQAPPQPMAGGPVALDWDLPAGEIEDPFGDDALDHGVTDDEGPEASPKKKRRRLTLPKGRKRESAPTVDEDGVPFDAMAAPPELLEPLTSPGARPPEGVLVDPLHPGQGTAPASSDTPSAPEPVAAPPHAATGPGELVIEELEPEAFDTQTLPTRPLAPGGPATPGAPGAADLPPPFDPMPEAPAAATRAPAPAEPQAPPPPAVDPWPSPPGTAPAPAGEETEAWPHNPAVAPRPAAARPPETADPWPYPSAAPPAPAAGTPPAMPPTVGATPPPRLSEPPSGERRLVDPLAPEVPAAAAPPAAAPVAEDPFAPRPVAGPRIVDDDAPAPFPGPRSADATSPGLDGLPQRTPGAQHPHDAVGVTAPTAGQGPAAPPPAAAPPPPPPPAAAAPPAPPPPPPPAVAPQAAPPPAAAVPLDPTPAAADEPRRGFRRLMPSSMRGRAEQRKADEEPNTDLSTFPGLGPIGPPVADRPLKTLAEMRPDELETLPDVSDLYDRVSDQNATTL